MNMTEVMGLVRHALTTFGGGLVASGYVSTEQWQQAVGGICVLIGIVWSFGQKRGWFK